MNTAYFDCFSGISGDMVVGAIIDAGVGIQNLRAELAKLDIKGYEIQAKKIKRDGICATKINIKSISGEKFSPQQLYNIIENSKLDGITKDTIRKIIKRLESAEEKIHKEVHFHELAEVDTIIDVSGAIIGLNLLKIDKVYSSHLPVGKGFVKSAHGELPIPAPATLEILKDIPIYGKSTHNELVTPTGAAIISTIAKEFGLLPQMVIKRVGYGAGDKEEPSPNLLRLIMGEEKNVYGEDIIELIETNIDDMNPEFYSYIMDKLFENGAIDVFFVPIYMKQNRPGVTLNVLSAIESRDNILAILFNETSTLGVRIQQIKRKKTERLIKEITTRFGKAKVKFSIIDNKIVNVAPECKDCERIAQHADLPIKFVYDEIKRAAYEGI